MTLSSGSLQRTTEGRNVLLHRCDCLGSERNGIGQRIALSWEAERLCKEVQLWEQCTAQQKVVLYENKFRGPLMLSCAH